MNIICCVHCFLISKDICKTSRCYNQKYLSLAVALKLITSWDWDLKYSFVKAEIKSLSPTQTFTTVIIQVIERFVQWKHTTVKNRVTHVWTRRSKCTVLVIEYVKYHHRQNGGFIYEHFLEKKISFAMLHRHYFNVLHVVQKMEYSQNIKKIFFYNSQSSCSSHNDVW